MISDAEVEKALDWLVKNADRAAKARAHRVYIEEFRKSLKASLMADSGATSVAAQEVAAYAHPQYLKLLDVLRAAVEEDEKFRWLQVAAEARIEAWRSFQANQRAQSKVT